MPRRAAATTQRDESDRGPSKQRLYCTACDRRCARCATPTSTFAVACVAFCPGAPARASDRQSIDRSAVQYLDRVRAIFRPARSDALAPGLECFIGREDIFRHVGTADTGSDGPQAMMQCPSYWPDGTTWVPIRDLEILEILEDQDVRAG